MYIEVCPDRVSIICSKSDMAEYHVPLVVDESSWTTILQMVKTIISEITDISFLSDEMFEMELEYHNKKNDYLQINLYPCSTPIFLHEDYDYEYDKDEYEEEEEKSAHHDSYIHAFIFHNLDEVITFSKQVTYSKDNLLYKESNASYYLIFPDLEEDDFILNYASEVCSMQTLSSGHVAYMKEHFECILKENALQILKQYL